MLTKHTMGERLARADAVLVTCYNCIGGYEDGKVSCEILDCPFILGHNPGTEAKNTLKEQHITKEQGTISPKVTPSVPLKKRLLTVEEASVYIGRSVCAVRELYWANKFPVVKSDNRVFIDIYDLDKWIEQNKCNYIQ